MVAGAPLFFEDISRHSYELINDTPFCGAQCKLRLFFMENIT
jgi:hypothetical protein